VVMPFVRIAVKKHAPRVFYAEPMCFKNNESFYKSSSSSGGRRKISVTHSGFKQRSHNFA